MHLKLLVYLLHKKEHNSLYNTETIKTGIKSGQYKNPSSEFSIVHNNTEVCLQVFNSLKYSNAFCVTLKYKK